MRILIAPDSFKGSLSAQEICEVCEDVAKRHFSNIEVFKYPLADGGEGTVESLVGCTGGEFRIVRVSNPLGVYIEARYGILGNSDTAVIEMAEASGLNKIQEKQRNPMITSTYGTGELIRHALDQGCKRFIIGIGGSATNDCGIGVIQALGAKVLDISGNIVAPGGDGLLQAHSIDLSGFDPRIKECSFTIACDVNNPLTGPNGAAYVYAPQKGATEEMVVTLDSGLKNFASLIKQQIGVDVESVPGAGAAGGLGACFLSFFQGKLQSGIEIVMKESNIEQIMEKVDIVITGEGKIDTQTKCGKTPFGVATLAKKYNIPVIAVCGVLDISHIQLSSINIDAAFSIINSPCNSADAISNGKHNLKNTLYNVIKLLQLKNK
ncbi:glycerate kinase [Desulfuribacillus stibiiarsenatis]|uniref:Glycerate kinase n=1 Tax=Desulfuribacillus stibiiarsenatis TaxID=1390249 RepID=A0A1E5L7J3_9FIRM|nr:glycerate kinase [Desulfuribacillus stibiiarsenatis]OEH85933.1 glycerate kinase [Desulfuribacillus stibiiarsenatis]